MKENSKSKTVKELLIEKMKNDPVGLEKTIAEFLAMSISAIIMVQIFIFAYSYFF